MFLRWLRRLFFGRSLEDHLAQIRQIQDSLKEFGERTRQQMEQKQHTVELLNAENAVHAAEMDRATLVRDNFEALMTQPIMPAQQEEHVVEEHVEEKVVPEEHV